MIHAYFSALALDESQWGGHGPYFKNKMKEINKLAHSKITVSGFGFI